MLFSCMNPLLHLWRRMAMDTWLEEEEGSSLWDLPLSCLGNSSQVLGSFRTSANLCHVTSCPMWLLGASRQFHGFWLWSFFLILMMMEWQPGGFPYEDRHTCEVLKNCFLKNSWRGGWGEHQGIFVFFDWVSASVFEFRKHDHLIMANKELLVGSLDVWEGAAQCEASQAQGLDLSLLLWLGICVRSSRKKTLSSSWDVTVCLPTPLLFTLQIHLSARAAWVLAC